MRSQILSVTSYLKPLFRECVIQANCLVLLAATFFIFIIDLHLPLGVVAGVPYALVILASLWVSGVQFTYLIAALGFLFTLLGFYLSPGIVIPMNVAFINLGLTLLLITCTVIMVIRIKKANFDMSALMTQTLTDPVSGHKNQDAFEIELNIEILRCNRYHRNLSIAVIDIDHFKISSDHHDHKHTNDVVKRISTEIKATIRISDLFYHINADEFAVVFPETELSEAKEVCEAIRKKISGKIENENSENKITTSIGIAMLENIDSKISLCKRAEDALHASKRQGGNMVSTIPQVSNKDKNHVAAILSRPRSE